MTRGATEGLRAERVSREAGGRLPEAGGQQPVVVPA